MSELAVGELLIVRAFRQRVADQRPASLRLAFAFRRVFGLAKVEQALTQFEEVFATLNGFACRDIGFRHPGCNFLGPDERLLLDLCAREQAGHDRCARECVDTLVGSAYAVALHRAVGPFGATLLRAARGLPVRNKSALPVQEVAVLH